MYGKSLSEFLGSQDGGTGVGQPPAVDPMTTLLSGQAKLQPPTPEEQYHQQRMDVLAALKRALDKGGKPQHVSSPGSEPISPQDMQAEKALGMLLQIYSKLPGGTELTTKSGKDTPFGQDLDWADKQSGGIGGYPGIGSETRYDFGKDAKGRKK